MLTATHSMNGLGDDASPVASVLDHALVPFRSAATYLRLVTTPSQALDYAAGGFHVSVDRGLAGGCTDPWTIHKGGTTAVACATPRNSASARAMWTSAAQKYLAVYTLAQQGGGLDVVKQGLNDANLLANNAYGQEGITPPVDPETQQPDHVGAAGTNHRKGRILMGAGLGLALFGVAAAVVSRKHKQKHGEKLTKKGGMFYLEHGPHHKGL